MILTDRSARAVVAHRGDSIHFPENTMEAFSAAAALGVDAIELDVHLSADGVAVVMHDATLLRTTGAQGELASLPVDALKKLDAGAGFSPDGGRTFPWRDRGVRIPLLTEVLTSFPDMTFVIEIKAPQAQHEVRRVLTDLGAARRTVVAAFARESTNVFRGTPQLIGASQPEMIALYLRPGLLRSRATPSFQMLFAPRRHWGSRVPEAPFLAAARALEIPMHTWVENDPKTALSLWNRGVTGIVTDDPTSLLAARKAAPRQY
jgi:glycerophosphoryl diester phosphodiesterase